VVVRRKKHVGLIAALMEREIMVVIALATMVVSMTISMFVGMA